MLKVCPSVAISESVTRDLVTYMSCYSKPMHGNTGETPTWLPGNLPHLQENLGPCEDREWDRTSGLYDFLRDSDDQSFAWAKQEETGHAVTAILINLRNNSEETFWNRAGIPGLQ